MPLHKIIISGGGTGGHIFPAIAIADALKVKHPNAEILFVGALGKMEMERVPKAGYKIIGLPVAGLQRRLTAKNLSFPFKLLKSLRIAKQIVKDFKPQVVIGVGGYASGPIVKMANKLGVPTLVQEQNSHPGLTNRLLSKKVDKICVAYPGLEQYFPKEKIVFTGNPIRQVFKGIQANSIEAKAKFCLVDKPTLLVVGGSLGAAPVNRAVENILEGLQANGIQLIWQTGKNYWQANTQVLENHNAQDGIWVGAFIDNMEEAYAAADLVVSRAGAIAISELMVLAKPSILVPSPYVAEDHQTKNALALSKETAAILIAETDLQANLIETVVELMADKTTLNEYANNTKKFAKPQAAEHIVEVIESIVA